MKGRVRSSGSLLIFVAVLKCSRSNGSWFESVVGRLLVMTNDLTGATAEAFSVDVYKRQRW